MWFSLQSYLSEEKREVRSQNLREISALSKSYSEQLARTIGQLDQVVLSLSYQWERSKHTLDLADQVGRGIFPDDSNFSAGISNRDGLLVTTLLPSTGRVNVSDRSYFKSQRDQPLSGLQFERLGVGRISGKPTIVFSRRINDVDGNFDGVVFVGVPRTFLTSYYFNAKRAGDASLLLLDMQGDVVAADPSNNFWVTGSGSIKNLAFPSDNANATISAKNFLDRKSRLVAWNTVSKYPLLAVATLPEEAVFASYEESCARYITLAIIASILLAIAGIAGLVTTLRLAWRKHQATQITETYKLATDGAHEGFFIARASYIGDDLINDFIIEDCNEHGAQMLGFTRNRLLGVRFSSVFRGEVLTELMSVFSNAMQAGFHEDDIRTLLNEGTTWIHRRLVRSGGGIAVTLRDISQEKDQEYALQKLANTDTLTSLPNRYWLSQNLPSILNDAQKKGASAAVLFLDLDNFKDINNTLGHEFGDVVLRVVGERIQSLLRPGDHVVRLGGDEFTVILATVATQEEAAHVSKRIIEVLAHPMEAFGRRLGPIRTSVGVCIFPQDGLDLVSLLRNADIAMYTAKNAGKGNFAFYNSSQTEQIELRLNSEAALRDAIDKKQFVLHYQPRVDALTGHLVGMEALVRWVHPERGMVPPLEFIPLAEETGLILPIGEFVIDRACAQIAAWGGFLTKPLTVSVNVSPIQFERGSIKETIEKATSFHKISPTLLELEITESCMMLNNDHVSADISALKTLGVRISVDDFGTGYSSLAQLQKMELDVIKVDRAFTTELTSGKHGEVFFMTIITMAHILDMKVVAEGVETLEQLTTLQALGCNEIQGYYVSKPVPADVMTELMQAGSLFPIEHRNV